MRRKRLLWQLYPFFLVCLLALLAISLATVRWLRGVHLEQLADDLQTRGELIARRLVLHGAPPMSATVEREAVVLGELTDTWVTIIDATGHAVGDSRQPPATMPNLSWLPEVHAALDRRVGRSIRVDPLLEQVALHVAIPIQRRERLAYVVRVVAPITALEADHAQAMRRILLGALLVVLLSALASHLLFQHIRRPLQVMRRTAEHFSAGQLARRLPIPETEELAGLAEAMNQMAAQLEERMRIVMRQRNELEAVLASMTEGVLAVDCDQRVLRLNAAAARQFGADAASAVGRSIPEVIRNTELQRFILLTLSSDEPVTAEIPVFTETGEQFLQAHGSLLRESPEGDSIGALVVLNDMTQMRRLETIRQEFVANVSHELKTPLTSIKGFVETLLDGAAAEPEEAVRFLAIVSRQVDRLMAIIEDLLMLSRVEQGENSGRIQLRPGGLRDVLQNAIETCDPLAAERRITIELSCNRSIVADLNETLLMEAVVNLLDNAIKYSPPETTVQLRGQITDDAVEVQVKDQGPGIPREHLDRLFERFYRVDKARSRDLGGTGLGLAIVKHIVQAHGGTVEVESRLGSGSTFTIRLPRHTAATTLVAVG